MVVPVLEMTILGLFRSEDDSGRIEMLLRQLEVREYDPENSISPILMACRGAGADLNRGLLYVSTEKRVSQV